MRLSPVSFFFFFNDTATTEIYTLSLHDALPISLVSCTSPPDAARRRASPSTNPIASSASRAPLDRKSTRLNSSHLVISYAVFCLKKKKIHTSQCRNRTSHQHPDRMYRRLCDNAH